MQSILGKSQRINSSFLLKDILTWDELYIASRWMFPKTDWLLLLAAISIITGFCNVSSWRSSTIFSKIPFPFCFWFELAKREIWARIVQMFYMLIIYLLIYIYTFMYSIHYWGGRGIKILNYNYDFISL